MRDITIKLTSGLSIERADAMLRLKFQQWPWQRYDGDPPTDANRVTIADVNRVYRLGARTSRANYARLIESHGRQINKLLRRLPRKALEDVDLQKLRKPLVDLFDLVLATKGIKLAGATKLLYPFRPALVPVIDSVLEDYYWWSTSLRNESRFRRLQEMRGWGEYVFELMLLMQEDVKSSRKTVDLLLEGCGDEPYARASRTRVIESLIWFHYARGGVGRVLSPR